VAVCAHEIALLDFDEDSCLVSAHVLTDIEQFLTTYVIEVHADGVKRVTAVYTGIQLETI
jgi:hypothetical protein